jgi:hypothetical protein
MGSKRHGIEGCTSSSRPSQISLLLGPVRPFHERRNNLDEKSAAFRFEVPLRARGNHCRNFKSAALGQLVAWRVLPAARARRLPVAQDGNVLGRAAKARKLLVIQITKPCAYAVLRRVVPSLNKSAHQARSDFQVFGWACSYASPQKVHVHDCRLLCCRKDPHINSAQIS